LGQVKPTPEALVSGIMKEDWGRLLAALISSLRDFQLAEDCLADAFTSALEHWRRGVPDKTLIAKRLIWLF